MTAIEERQWLPDPPAPWHWEIDGERWALGYQDPTSGFVIWATCARAGIGDLDVLDRIRSTIEHLPRTPIRQPPSPAGPAGWRNKL